MKVWLVNTNSNENNGNPNGYKFMLRQNRIATYYNKRNNVDKINKGDLILLYHNSNRIIAVGFAVNGPNHDFIDFDNLEHWVDINWFWKSRFNEHHEPIDFINRYDINIKMVNNSVVNITNQVDLYKLLELIGKRNYFE